MNSPATAQAQPGAPAVQDLHDLVTSLLNIRGAIHLSRSAVYDHADGNEALQAAEAVLCLAETEIDRLYALIDTHAMREAWLRIQADEVCHG